MTSRFTVSKTEKNLLADDASAERRYGSTGRGSASGYEDADFHGERFSAYFVLASSPSRSSTIFLFFLFTKKHE